MVVLNMQFSNFVGRLVAPRWRVSWVWLSASIGDCWAHASCELRLNVCFLGLASSHPRRGRRLRDERWPGGWRGSWGRTVGLSGWPASEGQDGQGRGDVTWSFSLLMICVTRWFSLPLICQDWNWIRFSHYLDSFRLSAMYSHVFPSHIYVFLSWSFKINVGRRIFLGNRPLYFTL